MTSYNINEPVANGGPAETRGAVPRAGSDEDLGTAGIDCATTGAGAICCTGYDVIGIGDATGIERGGGKDVMTGPGTTGIGDATGIETGGGNAVMTGPGATGIGTAAITGASGIYST